MRSVLARATICMSERTGRRGGPALIEEEEPVMGQVATEIREHVVNSVVEVRGDTLVVNVKNRDKASMFIPTMKIPLDHVLGAEADPEIERKLWRRWVLRSSKPGT